MLSHTEFSNLHCPLCVPMHSHLLWSSFSTSVHWKHYHIQCRVIIQLEEKVWCTCHMLGIWKCSLLPLHLAYIQLNMLYNVSSPFTWASFHCGFLCHCSSVCHRDSSLRGTVFIIFRRPSVYHPLCEQSSSHFRQHKEMSFEESNYLNSESSVKWVSSYTFLIFGELW